MFSFYFSALSVSPVKCLISSFAIHFAASPTEQIYITCVLPIDVGPFIRNTHANGPGPLARIFS